MNESNVFVDYMNRVRKSWVAKLSDETKELFKAMPQEERFKHYRDIDEKVVAEHRKLTRERREDPKRTTVKEIADMLDTAAETVVKSLIK